jgi:hypothetical protein
MNRRGACVEPGTPGGRFFRRYWHPIRKQITYGNDARMARDDIMKQDKGREA